MQTLLETAGVAVLVLLGLVVVAVLVAGLLWWRFRRWIGEKALAQQPDRIRLVEAADPPWDDEAHVEELADELRDAGWTDAGAFTIPELAGVCVHLWVASGARVAAALCDHPASERPWIDLWAAGEDGSTVTVTDNPQAGILAQPPWKLLVHRPYADLEDLVEAMAAEVPDSCRHLTAAELPRLFEEDWARETA